MKPVLIEHLDWEKTGGLIPAIVQDNDTGRVLMLGYMNADALARSLESRKVTFWSRSRQALWTKGETSGNYLELVDLRADCDSDALLVRAIPCGPTCHRNTESCFTEDSDPPGGFLFELEDLIGRRRREMPQGSYTTELFRQGLPRISRKLGEEAVEVIVSAWEDRDRTVSEAADLIYHLLVFLAERQVSWSEVVRELSRRHRNR